MPTMGNPNKAKGTRAESKVVKYLTNNGIKARRQALAGSDDQGDILVETTEGDYIVEVKTGKQTAAPNRTQIMEWCRQARVEAENVGGLPVLIVVRYNRSIEDADVYVPLVDAFRTHFYLEDWAKLIR